MVFFELRKLMNDNNGFFFICFNLEDIAEKSKHWRPFYQNSVSLAPKVLYLSSQASTLSKKLACCLYFIKDPIKLGTIPMDFIGPLLDIVNKIFWSPISKCVKYHRSLDKCMGTIKHKLDDLNRLKTDIESEIRAEIASQKIVKEQVQFWLEEVQRINDDKHLELEVGKGKYLSRARLGKSAVKKIQKIEELHQKASSFNGFMVDATPVGGQRFPPTTIVGETTAIRKMEEIWTSLISDDDRKIGVYGMGGSGKTTIMKDIHNRILGKKDKFDNAIWITVSKAIDLIKLQGDIASALKLDMEKIGDVAIRAAMLFEKLEQKKRWVIIFDDMWEAFKLEDVSIPEPTVDNGCKLILTTRSLDVCRRMNCKCIKMELLSKDEAWNLFLDKAGRDVILSTPDLEAIAKDIAKECACLPLAIITIGSTMNGEVDKSEWRNVLRELKTSAKGHDGMDEVIERLKLSYTRLKDEKLRRCLLYCALYPEDFIIEKDEVITYLIAEEIVEGMASWQEKCDEVNTILKKLERACLLESCRKFEENDSVKMHDVIRDMSLHIMGRKSMVKDRLRDFSDTKEWKEDLETVSLMASDVEEIYPDASPMCSRLKTLFLARNRGLTRIADTFFVLMPSLRILDISATKIQVLPDSISRLEHLRELMLKECRELKYVPSLAKLQRLRVLNLSHTGIVEMPQGLEMLVNLEYLDLFECRELTYQTGKLSKLKRLQCLKVFIESENREIAEEVARLMKLETLVVRFGSQNEFNTYVRSLQLQQRRIPNSFNLMVGPIDSVWARHYPISLARKLISVVELLDDDGREDVGLLFPNEDVEEVYIGPKVKLSSLCDVLLLPLNSREGEGEGEGEGSPSSSPPPPPPPLQQPMSSSTHFFFSCLRKLDIRRNAYITKLFTPKLMPLFQNLEEIWVRSCPNLQKIFSAALIPTRRFLIVDELDEFEEKEEEEEVEIYDDDLLIPMITLPKLRVLSLKDLPCLRSITQSRRGMMVCNSIQVITVDECPMLKRLPLSLPVDDDGRPSPPPSLTQIRISKFGGRERWTSLEWDNPLDKDVIQPFLRYIY